MALFLGPRCAPVSSSSAQTGPGSLLTLYCPGIPISLAAHSPRWVAFSSTAADRMGMVCMFLHSGSRIFISLERVIHVCLFLTTPFPFFYPLKIFPFFPKISLGVVQELCKMHSHAKMPDFRISSRASKQSFDNPSLIRPFTQIPKADSCLLPLKAIIKMSWRLLGRGS